MKKIVSILSIYFAATLLFFLGFSFLIMGHSLFTASPEKSTDLIKMSSSSSYLENPFATREDDDFESKTLLYEHKSLEEPKPPFDDNLSLKNFFTNYYSDIKMISDILYPAVPPSNQSFGTINIDSLSLEIPIYYDLTMNHHLKDGLAHDPATVLPGAPEHTILYGNGSTLLKKIKQIKKGELILIRTSAGSFTYQVQDMYPINQDESTFPDLTGEPSLSLTAVYSSHSKKISRNYVVYSILIDYSLSS